MKLLQALRTKPLRKAQLDYEASLRLSYRMKKSQHDDWEFIEKNEVSVLIRSRGGSKTFDFSNWIIFRVLRTQEKWVWLACKSGQLDQALLYVHQNPYVKYVKCLSSGKYDVHLKTGDIIRFGIISTSNLGLRCDGIMFDEFEDLQDKQENDVYPQMEGMMTVSAIHKTVYLGTLWIDTLLNEYAESYPSRIRPWRTLPWLVSAGMIQGKIDAGKTPQWQIDLLYNCIATAPTGLFFDQRKLHVLGKEDLSGKFYPLDYFEKLNLRPNTAGVDFNGGDVGHIVLEAYWDGTDLYAFNEYSFGDKEIPALDRWIRDHPTIATEVEGTKKMGSSAFNSGFADHLMTLGTPCYYNFWENNSKHKRLALLQRANLYIHPNCKWLIKNIKEGAYEKELSRTNIGVAQLHKRTDQHGLDCAIHAVNSGGALDIVKTHNQYGTVDLKFQQQIDLMRYRR